MNKRPDFSRIVAESMARKATAAAPERPAAAPPQGSPHIVAFSKRIDGVWYSVDILITAERFDPFAILECFERAHGGREAAPGTPRVSIKA